MSLIVTIFVLVLVTQLVSWIGQGVLLEIAYAMHLQVFYSASIARQRTLQKELLNTKSELLRTSAQDQFAKWAKLRRNVDKGLVDLEKSKSKFASIRTSFAVNFNAAIWMLTTGVQLVVGWRYRKSAVFYLPEGWLGPLGWWLALPFAPEGSVSVGVWQMACKRFIKICERLVKALVAATTHAEAMDADGQASEMKKS